MAIQTASGLSGQNLERARREVLPVARLDTVAVRKIVLMKKLATMRALPECLTQKGTYDETHVDFPPDARRRAGPPAACGKHGLPVESEQEWALRARATPSQKG